MPGEQVPSRSVVATRRAWHGGCLSAWLPAALALVAAAPCPARADEREAAEAARLHGEAAALHDGSRGEQARPLALRALSLRQRALGADHLDTAATRCLLGEIHLAARDEPRAEEQYRLALAAVERRHGPQHLQAASALEGMAGVHLVRREADRAEALLHRALAIREQRQGPSHADLARPLTRLAQVYWHSDNQLDRVEPLLRRALGVLERAPTPDALRVAEAARLLGVLLVERRQFAEAEALLRRALTLAEGASGLTAAAVGESLRTLGRYYAERGDPDRADPYYRRALEVLEQGLGARHLAVADVLTNLAINNGRRRGGAAVEPLHRRALAIREQHLGPDHVIVAQSLNNLGNHLAGLRDYSRAKPLLERALRIWERHWGADHPDVGVALANLANLHARQNEPEPEERLWRRALDIWTRRLRPDHGFTRSALDRLSALCAARGDLPAALDFRERLEAASERELRRVLAAGSQDERETSLGSLTKATHATISLHATWAPRDARAARLALQTILRRKGRAVDAMAETTASLRRSLDPADRALLDRVGHARGRLALRLLRGRGSGTEAAHLAAVDALTAEVEKLETAIGRRSSVWRAQAQETTVERVQAAIPPGAALVEIAYYWPLDALPAGKVPSITPRYLAYVLHPQGAVLAVDLGRMAAIDWAARKLRTALASAGGGETRKAARELDRLVMEPIRPLLRGARTVLLAPDGVLNLVPFGALVDEQGRFLVESLTISYLTSGRDLLRLQGQTPARQGPVVVADPDFDAGAEGAPVPAAPSSQRSLGFERQRFDRLPGTADEAAALRRLLPGAKVLTERRATEAAIKQLRAPEILHVATHGFFLASPSGDTMYRWRRETFALGEGSRARKLDASPDHPLARSGLVLAGANHRRKGAEDGVLTALEVAGLDLLGTRLVVMSACDTGMAQAERGNGVYGLRRALVLAGAQSQLMSLWKVDDTATRELMVAYYTALRRGRSRADALRDVQLAMLRDSRRRDPYFWAAFIPSGDWRPLSSDAARPR